mgnify:CR=1 FL=1
MENPPSVPVDRLFVAMAERGSNPAPTFTRQADGKFVAARPLDNRRQEWRAAAHGDPLLAYLDAVGPAKGQTWEGLLGKKFGREMKVAVAAYRAWVESDDDLDSIL